MQFKNLVHLFYIPQTYKKYISKKLITAKPLKCSKKISSGLIFQMPIADILMAIKLKLQNKKERKIRMIQLLSFLLCEYLLSGYWTKMYIYTYRHKHKIKWIQLRFSIFRNVKQDNSVEKRQLNNLSIRRQFSTRLHMKMITRSVGVFGQNYKFLILLILI